ncbi:MAG TPA: hypothetical protein VF458_22970, partial [Ktedonobacteraceae bacterium]
ILRVVSAALIICGLYLALNVIFARVASIGPATGVITRGSMISMAPGVALTGLFYGAWNMVSPLGFVSLGLSGLALATRRARLVYWSLQVLLWFGSMSVWFMAANFASQFTGQTGIEVPGSFAPFFSATLVLSLVLFAAYVPVVRLLRRLLSRPEVVNPLART